jgi:hypothetical protein
MKELGVKELLASKKFNLLIYFDKIKIIIRNNDFATQNGGLVA